jgi:hypothetical protein
LFPNDTIQSRLPEPGWLDKWLDQQIKFDGQWESKVIDRILHNLSLLFGKTFTTVQDLNRYRKSLNAEGLVIATTATTATTASTSTTVAVVRP